MDRGTWQATAHGVARSRTRLSDFTHLQTVKFQEENIDKNLHDIGLGNDFNDMALKAQETKDKINKLDFLKMKKLCASKDNYQEGGAKIAEDQAGETTFSPTNSSKEQLNAEQTSQNNF